MPTPSPQLSRLEPDGPARGVVLMLHGGAEHGTEAVGPRHLAPWRTGLMRSAIAPRLLTAGHAVWLLRFSVKGWNPELPEPSPVADGRWALDQVTAVHPGVPVVLIGHSMGARTAVHVACHGSVTGVVALAPWFVPHDPVSPLQDRRLVAAHGRADRITRATATRAYVDRARQVARSAEFVDVGDLGHYMLRRSRTWNRLALRHSLEMLTLA